MPDVNALVAQAIQVEVFRGLNPCGVRVIRNDRMNLQALLQRKQIGHATAGDVVAAAAELSRTMRLWE